MTEIEILFENAGIKKLLYCDICNAQKHALGLCAETKCEPFYPPFTAEKQIELIKWLAKHYGNIHILNNVARGFAIGIEGVSFNLKKFEEIIAMVLNTFWQDLTDQDKEEIRRILNE